MEVNVYVLRSEKDGTYYVGLSGNVERRLEEHNRGKVKSTKTKVPWTKVYEEQCSDRSTARKREKYLKSAAGRRFRKKMGM